MTDQAAEAVASPVEEPVEAPVAPEDPFEGLESESFKDGELDAVEAPAREVLGVPDAEPVEPEPEPVKPKQTAQERINELTRLRREAERRAEAAEARLRETEKPPEPPKETEKPPEAETAAEGPPDPTTFDYGELDPRYITALVEYQTDQRLDAYRKEEADKAETRRAEREHKDVQEKFEKQVDKGSAKHEDFYEKVVEGAEKGEWALSIDLAKMLADSEVGDDIAYHLASHPDESLDISRQSPVEQARYFGKMEAKFSATQSAAPGKTETKPPKAPPPVMPARGADGKFSASADSEDFSAFEKVVNSQE